MTMLSPTARPSTFAVFRNRSFTLLWIGEFISTMGSALTSLAASILVYRVTGSALSVGLMLIATALPSLLIGLIAGVFVDRFDRRWIMIISDLLRGVLVLAIPFLLPYGIAWLYVIVILSSAITQFFAPAHESVLPEVATEEELGAANSFIAISSFGSTAVGFAAAGLLASQFSISWAFYLDALSFLVSALCIIGIRIAPVVAEGETNVASVLRNLREGGRVLVNNAVLRSLLITSVPLFIGFGLWNSLLLPFATHALHASEFAYGLQEGLTSVGFVVASLLMARLTDRLREGQWIVISFVGMGLVSGVYALSSSVPFAIALVMLSGFLNAPSSIARRLLIQRNTPREVRGRVNSAFFVSRDIVFLIGMAAAGLADRYDVRLLVLSSALLVLAAGLLTLVMPGLGQPAAEWLRAVRMMRTAASAPGLGLGRVATLADFDLLAQRVPDLAALSMRDRASLTKSTYVHEVDPGTVIVRRGDTGNDAFFILKGRAVAGREEQGTRRSLEVLSAGDFFGEIAALTGVARTADVIADEPTTVLQVPSTPLHTLMSNPQLQRLFMSKLTERMIRMDMIDLPRFATLDQQSLLELRTPDPQPVA